MNARRACPHVTMITETIICVSGETAAAAAMEETFGSFGAKATSDEVDGIPQPLVGKIHK